jgi:DASH complex subunit DAM1
MDSSRRWGRPSFAGTAMGDGSTTAYDATLMGPADQTYMTQDDDIDLGQRKPTLPSAQQKAPLKPALKSAMKKPTPVSTATGKTGATVRPGQVAKSATSVGASTSAAAPQKPKITAAEKKRREAAAEQVIELLPLDYRGGSDPSAKRLAMSVILALIAAGQKGIRINEIVRAPDLPQAKVNKCLIALVGAKQVLRRSDNGVVYHLDPEKNPIAA